MSREMLNMFEHLSWVNLWCSNKYSNSAIKTYHESLQNELKIRLINFVMSSHYKVPPGHQGMKKMYRNYIRNRNIRESIRDDFRILSALLKNNPLFFGYEPTPHDLQAFSNLAQLRLMYKEIQYLSENVKYEIMLYTANVEFSLQDCVTRCRVKICATIKLYKLERVDKLENIEEGRKKSKKAKKKNKKSSENVKEYSKGMVVVRYNDTDTEEDEEDEEDEDYEEDEDDEDDEDYEDDEDDEDDEDYEDYEDYEEYEVYEDYEDYEDYEEYEVYEDYEDYEYYEEYEVYEDYEDYEDDDYM